MLVCVCVCWLHVDFMLTSCWLQVQAWPQPYLIYNRGLHRYLAVHIYIFFLPCHRILDCDCDNRTYHIILRRKRPGQDSSQSCVISVLVRVVGIVAWSVCCLGRLFLLATFVYIVVVIAVHVVIMKVISLGSTIPSLLVICWNKVIVEEGQMRTRACPRFGSDARAVFWDVVSAQTFEA